VQLLLTDRLADLDRQITDLTALRATVAQLRNTVAAADPALGAWVTNRPVGGVSFARLG